MNPNDARIRRIYTREQNQTIVDDSLGIGVANELVIEWEAGSVINSLAVNLDLHVVTRNITNNANEPAPLSQTFVVTTDGVAANTGYTQVINIPANTLNTGDMYESIACLVRSAVPIHSFSDWWLFLGI